MLSHLAATPCFSMQQNRIPTDFIKQLPAGPAQLIFIYCIAAMELT